MPFEANDTGFWTDEVQALERLNNTFILHGDDVVFVDGVKDNKINFRKVESFDKFLSAPLNDRAWGDFRKLPPLGWLNVVVKTRDYKVSGAVFLRRIARRTRSHGLNNDNVLTYQLDQNGIYRATLPLGHVYGCGLYKDAEQYPSFEQAFGVLKEGRAIALSEKFCLFKDIKGLSWLYRKRRPVLLVPDIRTGLLLKSERFYREDLEANQNVLPIEIKDL